MTRGLTPHSAILFFAELAHYDFPSASLICCHYAHPVKLFRRTDGESPLLRQS
jgi:hypothetical protein